MRGRVLAVLSLLLTFAGFWFFVVYLGNTMPGESFPIIGLIAAPVIVALLFFFTIAWVFEQAGVRIFQ